MAEMQITRVNFFDGQFLKEDEFLQLDAYHRHMRRRWAYVMFDKTGVVPANPNDLKLDFPAQGTLPAEKKIEVNTGMAIVRNDDLREAKEVVLQSKMVLDLSASALGLLVNDIAIITLHYFEQPTLNSTDGDVSGDTRIDERAELRVQKAIINAPNPPALPPATFPPLMPGDSYVRLGAFQITAAGLTAVAGLRDTALLNTALFAAAPPQNQITLTPNVGPIGSIVNVDVTSPTNLDLSGVTAAAVIVTPSSDIQVTVVSSTTNLLELKLDIKVGALATPARKIAIKGVEANFTATAAMVVTGSTPPDVPGGSPNLILTGSGLVAGQDVDLIFQGGNAHVPGALVTANQISVPINLIPINATDGTITVLQGSNQTVSPSISLPAKVTKINNVSVDPAPATPPSVSPGGLLTLEGKRFNASLADPLHVRIVRLGVGNELLHRITPFSQLGENQDDHTIAIRIPANLNGDAEVRVETKGGKIVAGVISIQ